MAKKVLDLTGHNENEYQNTLQVIVGETFEILIKETPTTGFQWLTVERELEKHGVKDLLKQMNRRFSPD